MLLKNRIFERREPSRNAKSFYFFCEGVRREYKYFMYFKEIDSRINVEIYPLNPNENNSPTGLFEIAKNCLLTTNENAKPKYDFINKLDEVWFVIDTDEWGEKVDELRKLCKEHENWKVAQSNPSFEVWLYYHFFDNKPEFDEIHSAQGWKNFVNEKINGGFDSRRHPILLEEAINNSKKNYLEENGNPNLASTQVYLPAESMFPLLQEKINDGLKSNKIS